MAKKRTVPSYIRSWVVEMIGGATKSLTDSIAVRKRTFDEMMNTGNSPEQLKGWLDNYIEGYFRGVTGEGVDRYVDDRARAIIKAAIKECPTYGFVIRRCMAASLILALLAGFAGAYVEQRYHERWMAAHQTSRIESSAGVVASTVNTLPSCSKSGISESEPCMVTTDPTGVVAGTQYTNITAGTATTIMPRLTQPSTRDRSQGHVELSGDLTGSSGRSTYEIRQGETRHIVEQSGMKYRMAQPINWHYLDLETTETCWLMIYADGEHVIEGTMPANWSRTVPYQHDAAVRTGCPGKVTYWIDYNPVKPKNQATSPAVELVTFGIK